MNVTGLAKGLTQIGQYALARKQQDFKTKEMYALEQLKNEMWNRKLRQQTQQAESQRQFLMKKFETEQREETLRQQSKHDFELQKEREKRDAELNPETLENRLKTARIKEIENKIKSGYYAKHKDDKDKDTKELKDMLDILKVSTKKYDEFNEPIPGTGDPSLYRNTMRAIGKYSEEKLGVPSGITGATPQDTMLNFYDSLVRGGFTEDQAQKMVEQKFGNRQQPTTKKTTGKETWKDYLQ